MSTIKCCVYPERIFGNDVEEKIENYKKAIEIEYYSKFSLWDEGKVQLTKAIEVCTESIKNNPQDINALLYRADALSVIALSEDCVSSFREAIEDFSRVIELDSLNIRAYDGRAWIQHCWSSYYDDKSEAIKDYLKIIEFDPQNINAYHNMAVIKHLGLQDYTEAIKDFTSIIEIDSNNDEAYFNRGDVKVDKNDISGAIEDFSKAIEINPNCSFYYYHRGSAKEKLQLYQEALEDYAVVFKIDNNKTNYYYRSAKIKEKMNDIDNAIKDYLKAIENTKFLDCSYYDLCLLYCKINEYDKAKEILQKGEALYPGCDEDDYGRRWDAVRWCIRERKDIEEYYKYCFRGDIRQIFKDVINETIGNENTTTDLPIQKTIKETQEELKCLKFKHTYSLINKQERDKIIEEVTEEITDKYMNNNKLKQTDDWHSKYIHYGRKSILAGNYKSINQNRI